VTATRDAEVMLLVDGLLPLEEGAPVELFIAQELVGGAVKGVGAGFGRAN
jgi:hypothetical protein